MYTVSSDMIRDIGGKKGRTATSITFFITFLAGFVLFFVYPATALSAQKVGVRVIAVITGDEFMGRLKQPSGLFFDRKKNRLYVADSGNGRLVSFDSKFKYLAELSHDAMVHPTSIVRDASGNFFVVDGGKGELLYINIAEREVTPFRPKGVPPGGDIFVPGRLAIGGDGKELYVIDKLNKRILVVDATTGEFLKEIAVSGGEFFGFTDVRVGNDGKVYALDTIGRTVYVFTKEGELSVKFTLRDDGKETFKFPVSLVTSWDGFIYVLDAHAGKIFVFDGSGKLRYSLLRAGVKEGELSAASYIFMDRTGRIYTIDGSRVQVFREDRE